MHSRVFLFLLLGLSSLVALTTPSLLKPLLQSEATPTAPTVTATSSPTPTATLDPFGHVPTVTPMGANTVVYQQPLPTPALGALPPTFTPEPTPPLPPNDFSMPPLAMSATVQIDIPTAPTPSGPPPDRLYIPRLNRNLPVEPVGMVPSQTVPGVFEWGVPDHQAAGWLNTSAAFGVPGNTVLDGHHNVKGEAFRDLWTLQPGDELSLFAGAQVKPYLVKEVMILPERDQPLEARLANARYIQPTDDERLTLITCWPYESNTHRVIVIAFPK
jgi:sortase A